MGVAESRVSQQAGQKGKREGQTHRPGLLEIEDRDGGQAAVDLHEPVQVAKQVALLCHLDPLDQKLGPVVHILALQDSVLHVARHLQEKNSGGRSLTVFSFLCPLLVSSFSAL
mgnify:CR=1 FL=1